MSINRVVVSGNLTRDPELVMAGSTPLLKLGIAVNDRRRNASTGEWEDVPNFFDVSVWGNRGEGLARILKKGTKVAISGKLRWNSWKTDTGESRSKVEIVADEVEFMSSRDSAGYQASGAPSFGAQRDTGSEPGLGGQIDSGDDAFTDDIPFV